MATVSAVRSTARAELPDVLVGATAERNIRGLWSKYRPARHRRESHEFPDRQESAEEAGCDRLTPLRWDRPRRQHRRFSAQLPESDNESSLLLDLIPQSRVAHSQQRRHEPSRRTSDQRDAQRTVLFPRRRLHQPCSLCGQVPGDDTQQLAYEHLKLQVARDRLAAEEARVEAQEHYLALKQELFAREKEVEVLMTYAQVSVMQLRELVYRQQDAVTTKLAGSDEQTGVAWLESGLMSKRDEIFHADGDEHANAVQLAAMRIQAAHRGKAARQQQREMRAAAACIQAARRGRAVRAELAEEKAAAVRIQAIHRGKLSRNELAEQRDAAIRIQASHRGKAIRQEAAQQRDAAVRIQSCYRGTHARQEATTAVALQRAQELEQARRMEAAATNIQAIQRGRAVRVEFQKQIAEQQHSATTRIQAWWRGQTARSRIPSLQRAKRRRDVLTVGSVGMRIEKRNAGHDWEEGYITSIQPLLVTQDCSIGPIYVTDAPGSYGMSWDDVQLLSPERKAQVDGLAALALEERRRQEQLQAAARAKAEAEALQQAISEAEAQVQLARADCELAVGTRIAFHCTNDRDGSNTPFHGKYARFKKNRTGANEHHIDFGGSGNTAIRVLRLKKIVDAWRVVPMSDFSTTREMAGEGAALATLVAELKPGEQIA